MVYGGEFDGKDQIEKVCENEGVGNVGFVFEGEGWWCGVDNGCEWCCGCDDEEDDVCDVDGIVGQFFIGCSEIFISFYVNFFYVINCYLRNLGKFFVL